MYKSFSKKIIKKIKNLETKKHRIGLIINSEDIDLRYRSSKKFFMCSIPKIIWVTYTLKCIDDKLFNFNSEVKIMNKRYAQYAFGTGILQYLLIKANELKEELREKLKSEKIEKCKKSPRKTIDTITLKEAMKLSVNKSDNLAIISLVDFLEENSIPRSKVQNWLENIINSKDIVLMDSARDDTQNLNWGTLDSLVKFISLLLNGCILNRSNTSLLSNWMQNTESENRLGTLKSDSTKVIHKTGQIGKLQVPQKNYFIKTYCDIGLIRSPDTEIYIGIFYEYKFKKKLNKEDNEKINKTMIKNMQEIIREIKKIFKR